MMPEQLTKIYTSYQKELPELYLDDRSDEVKQMAATVAGHRFSLVLVGEFSTGKSTMINAMIGRNLLPSSAIPTTKHKTVLTFGERDTLRATTATGGEELALTTDAISTLTANPDVSLIEITLQAGANKEFQEFVLIDTPGANDPNELDDEIIFNTFDHADVILLLLDVNQAFKDTEKEFLKRAVLKKDLAKFFFLVNRADESVESFSVKKNVIENLRVHLGIEDQQLENLKKRVLVVSGRRALDAIISGDKERLSESGYLRMAEAIRSFIADNSERLLTDAFKAQLLKTVDEIYVEANLLHEQYHRKLSGQDSGLSQLDTQLKELDLAMESDKALLVEDIRREEQRLAERIRAGGKRIIAQVLNYIDQTPDAHLNPRSVEVYANKLFRELMADEFRIFQESVGTIIGNFDSNLDQRLKQNPVIFQSQSETHYMRSGLKIVGMGAAGAAAVTYFPTVVGAAAVGTLLPLIGGGVLSGLAAIGVGLPALVLGAAPALIGAVSTIGMFASGFVSGAWKLLAATASGIASMGDQVEKSMNKTRFKHHVESSLTKVRENLIANLCKGSDEQINAWLNAYMTEKFPQKKILECHKADLVERFNEDHDKLRQHTKRLAQFMCELDVERKLLFTDYSA